MTQAKANDSRKRDLARKTAQIKRLKNGTAMRDYYYTVQESSHVTSSSPIQAVSIYAAALQVAEKFPNCIYKISRRDEYENGRYDLEIPAEYLAWKPELGFIQESIEQQFIKGIRAEIRLWAEYIKSPVPDFPWVSAYYCATGYLNPDSLKIKDEHRPQFTAFINKLRPYTGSRPAASEYEFGLGCDEGEADKAEAELKEMFKSWGIIITPDTFKRGNFYVDVDKNVWQVKITLQQLYEELESASWWNSLTPKQKAKLEKQDLFGNVE